MARAYKIAATAFDAVDQAVAAHLFLIIGTGIPEQLLWQQLNRTHGGTIATAYAWHLVTGRGRFGQNENAVCCLDERHAVRRD